MLVNRYAHVLYNVYIYIYIYIHTKGKTFFHIWMGTFLLLNSDDNFLKKKKKEDENDKYKNI